MTTTTRRRVLRCGVAGLLVAAVVVTGSATAVAVPPPPPNPSDAQLDAGKAAAAARAGEVGRLTARLAELEASRLAAQAELELRLELANKAQVDLETAEAAAAAARTAADQAAIAAAAAAAAIEDARRKVDRFAAGSYQQGSTIGSMSAFLGAEGPEDVIARAHFLNAIGDSQIDVLDGLERARATQANKDSAARAALDEANAKQAAAEAAKAAADAAYGEAQAATAALVGQVADIDARKAEVEQQLAAAQAQIGALEGQRRQYLAWQEQKRAEEEAARRAAEEAARRAAEAAQVSARSGGGGGGGGSARSSGSAAPVGGGVETVVARALSQLGAPYAWGGGDAGGPTRGVRDGGVADAFGDYAKVGFDCSGLMIYAFAGVGIRLPHYSGYQAQAGRTVPQSQKRRGDLLFWATGGRIHHVALYLGDGMMVEAPYSGSRVRVTAVRSQGLLPYVTRLL